MIPRIRSGLRGVTLAVLAILAFAVAELLWRGGALAPVEQRVQDFWFQAQGSRGAVTQVAIVALDDETLAAYPDDPLVFWTDRLAVAVGRLREVGAATVGLDLLLSISPERWLGKLGGELRDAARDYDRPFREQINSGRLILASTRSGSGAKESDYLLPSPDYLLALPDFDIPGHVALADLFDEGDGVIRAFVPSPVPSALAAPIADAVPGLGLPTLVALRAAGLDPKQAFWTLAGRPLVRGQPAEAIPYRGPPGTFPRVSLLKLLKPDAAGDPEVRALAGKAVVLGATAAGLNDEHFTPYATRLFGGRGPLMSGVEIHANVVEALLSGERLESLGDLSRGVSLLLATALMTAACVALPAWAGGLAWLVATLLAAAASFLAFRSGVLVPVSVYVLACGLALLMVLGWRLTGEQRERARLRQMFGRYVSAQVVESLLASGQRPELGGQAQTVTVLFSDIRNFTTISEKLNAREVVEMLNTYFERACEPLLEAGGSIDKFIGDAIMVEFGSPVAQPDHARRALRAALALAAVAEDFAGWMATRFPDRDLPRFAVGIGLHSGEAVIGNIGSPARMEFTAIGDTVNLASRLEGMTKELGCVILASEATLRAAGEGAACGRSEVIRVKGRAEPVRVHEILGWTEARGDGEANGA